MQINDIVCITGKQKTDEEGKLKGYGWYCDPTVGVLIAQSETSVTIKTADKTNKAYELETPEYSYSVSQGSEVEFLDLIEKEIFSKKSKIKSEEEELTELLQWKDTVKYEISMLGRMASFIKSFVNNK